MEHVHYKHHFTNETVVFLVTTLYKDVRQTSQIISNDVIYYFDLYISIVWCSLLSYLGVIANVLNLIVYWKQGIKDSVNINFILLSLWDLSNSLLTGLSVLCFIIDSYFPVPSVKITAIQYAYLGYTRGLMYILSTNVTVYLSIERCVCIMVPLKVKEIFTKSRVCLMNLIIVLFGVTCFSPAWATQCVQWVLNPETNNTQLVLWLSFNRREVDMFVDTFNGVVIPFVAQCIITVSAGFMIHGIKKSAQFRQHATKTKKQKKNDFTCIKSEPMLITSDQIHTTHTLTNKDVKVTKVVIFVALIFFVCNLPVCIVALVRALFPDVDVGKAQFNLYKLFYTVVYQCGLINSAVNILVYYHFSTRYKRVFLKVIGRKTSKL